MKMVGILPFRLLDRARKYIPKLDYPSPARTKLENRKLVQSADLLVAFIDDEFFKPGKSIGTKVEIVNNRDKLLMVVYFETIRVKCPIPHIRPISTIHFNEKLPTWDEYASHTVANDKVK